MASPADKELVERIKSAVDIVDVAQGYFPVQRKGERFVALCPFHREKTPSFSLNAKLQIFHCFGCQKSGDVFTLVMELDRLTFREALKVLARRAGIPLLREAGSANFAAEERRLRLHTVLKHAEDFFREQLRGSVGMLAREYLERRGFGEAAVEEFAIGYAPAEYRALLDHLKNRGHLEEDILRAGVCKRKEETGRTFDLLRRRIVIPIRDARGRCVAFGGRLLDDATADSGPKYLNTPETEVFSKRQVLFGFDRAREEAARRGTFVIVEGYLDVIAAHHHGARHVVATLGTALTPDHAALMQRYANRAILLFDPDEGGQRGADRGAAILLRAGFDVLVAHLPDGLDPDEYLEQKGLAAFEEFLATGSEDLVSYLVRRALERCQGGSDGARAKAAREVLAFVGQIADSLQRDLMLKRMAQSFGIDEGNLRRIAAELARQAPREPESRGSAGPPRPIVRKATAAWELDEVFTLHGALTCATLAGRVAMELSEADFRDSIRRRVYSALRQTIAAGTPPVPSLMIESLKEDPEACAVVEYVVGVEIPAGDSAERAFDRLVSRRSDSEYRRLRDDVRKSGDAAPDEDALERKLRELSRLQAERYQRLKDAERGRASSG